MFSELRFLNTDFTLSSSLSLLVTLGLVAVCILMLPVLTRSKFSWRFVFLVLSAAVGSIVGGRLFFLLFENSAESLKWTDMLAFSGMTFYGAFISGIITVWLYIRLLIPSALRLKALDASAVLVSLSYAVLRVNCFLQGCCWGKKTAVSHAVIYYQTPFNPYLGIPLHPVQLYDAVLGLVIFGILLSFHFTRKFQGYFLEIFMVLYASGRFVTEMYRGDSFRGTKILFHFSTSQCISMALMGLAIMSLAYRLYLQTKVQNEVSV